MKRIITILTILVSLILLYVGGVFLWEAAPRARGLRCNNHLRQIEAAKAQVAQMLGLTNGASVTIDQIAPYLAGDTVPKCPSGGTYGLNTIGQDARCTRADDAATGEQQYWHSLGTNQKQ